MVWIPVGERLPESGVEVLVRKYDLRDEQRTTGITSLNFWRTGFYVDCEEIDGDEVAQEKVTHWMPLPPPPKEKK
jgi:hypothetical protein